jgi:PilZ domain
MPARNQIKNYDERRGSPRLPPSAIPALKGVKLVAGPEVRLVNISRGGALIESEARLSPGSNLCLRLVTAESVYLLKGQVLRSRVASLAGAGLRYQSAISFSEEFSILPRREGPHESQCSSTVDSDVDSTVVPSSLPSESPPQADITAEGDWPELETVTVNSDQSDFDFSELLRRNSW